MTKKKILETLIKLKETIDELKHTSSDDTEKRKKLHDKMVELYGSIEVYYSECIGNLSIKVPVAGSRMENTFKNFFEAGYLSGRTFHTYQGYNELLKVIGMIRNMENIVQQESKNSSCYSRSEKHTILTIFFAVIGGAFILGLHLGGAKFDQEKIDLTDENKQLKSDTTSLKQQLIISNDSILKLQTLVLKYIPMSQEKSNVYNVSVSYYAPTSIFDGQVFITADSYYKKLEFKGIYGIDTEKNGKYESKNINVKEGDRFFLKLENNEIWVVNVMNTLIGIELEYFKCKNCG